MITSARSDAHATITGLGAYAPERMITNAELSQLVETSDEWIIERTGIRERRIAADEQALSDICLPAAQEALGHRNTLGEVRNRRPRTRHGLDRRGRSRRRFLRLLPDGIKDGRAAEIREAGWISLAG